MGDFQSRCEICESKITQPIFGHQAQGEAVTFRKTVLERWVPISAKSLRVYNLKRLVQIWRDHSTSIFESGRRAITIYYVPFQKEVHWEERSWFSLCTALSASPTRPNTGVAMLSGSSSNFKQRRRRFGILIGMSNFSCAEFRLRICF